MVNLKKLARSMPTLVADTGFEPCERDLKALDTLAESALQMGGVSLYFTSRYGLMGMTITVTLRPAGTVDIHVDRVGGSVSDVRAQAQAMEQAAKFGELLEKLTS